MRKKEDEEERGGGRKERGRKKRARILAICKYTLSECTYTHS